MDIVSQFNIVISNKTVKFIIRFGMENSMETYLKLKMCVEWSFNTFLLNTLYQIK